MWFSDTSFVLFEIYTFYMHKRTYILHILYVQKTYMFLSCRDVVAKSKLMVFVSKFMEPVVCFMNISGYAILGCELKWKIWNHVSCTKMFWIGFCHPIFSTAGLVNN